jgi:hypothetical protein
VYKLRKVARARVRVIQASTRANLAADVVQEVKVKMTMKYGAAHVTLRNILIPMIPAARDVVNAWWAAVDRQQVTDSNITCLPRNWNEYNICNADEDPIGDIAENMEIFLSPKSKTNPETDSIMVTWDGFGAEGPSLKLSICPRVHREESGSRLLARWIEYYRMRPEHAEIASQLFTSENEYFWKDHAGKETAPPWKDEEAAGIL